MLKNLDQLFPEKKDKREAAEHLRFLADAKGWKILEQLIDEELKAVDIEIKTTKFSAENLNKLSELQMKFAYLNILKKLPKEIASVLLDEKSADEIEFDVY